MSEPPPEIPLPYNISFKVVNGDVVISLKGLYAYLEKLELTYHRLGQYSNYDNEEEQTFYQASAQNAALTISYLQKRLRHVFTEENIRKYSRQK